MDISSFWGIQHIVINAHVATAALCAYEYILTLPQEIRFVWLHQKSLVSILFLVNRYSFVLYSASGLVQLIPWGPNTQDTATLACDVVARLNDICMIVMHLVLAIFAAIRTYAIWDKNKVVFACVLGLGLLFPIGDIYRLTLQVYRPYPWPIPGCSTYSSLPDGLTPKIGSDQLFCLMGLGSNVLFELVVVLLTWVKTLPALQQIEWMNMSLRKNLTYIIFRNGTFHFLSILIINLSGLPQFIPMITSGRVDRDSQPHNLQVSDKGIVTSLIEAITSILISRFILDLREDYVAKGQDSGSSLHIGDMSFRVNPQTLDLYSSDERRCDLENCRSDKLSRPV